MPDPLFVSPMLAVHGPLPRDLGAYNAELKMDGIRVVVTVDAAGLVHAYSRTGVDATVRYPELQDLPRPTGRLPLVLDGEIVALDAKGLPDFGLLQRRMTLRQPAAIQAVMRQVPVVYMVFDVLRLGVRPGDTTQLPYLERRQMLEELDLNRGPVRTPAVWAGEAGVRAAIDWTLAHGLEGVILKRRSSVYSAGARSRDWIKVKHRPTMTVVLGGWESDPHGQIRSLLVGTPSLGGGLQYLGQVGSGLSEAQRRILAPLFAEAASDTNPFTVNPPPAHPRVHWLLPLLAGEVEYAEITRGSTGVLRQPSWKGLRGLAGEAPQ